MTDENPEASEEETYQSYLDSACTLEQLGINVNDRIEVKWTIEQEDPASSIKRWWGARLVEVYEEDPRRMTLLYDSHEDFSETRNDVLFLTETTLYDIEEQGELFWRREGDLVDSTDFENAEEDLVTIADLIDDNEQSALSQESALESLPHTLQVQVAERLAKFSSELSEFLKEKREQRGPNVVIKVEDVEDFVSKMKTWNKK